ncbi:unnamed protein product, partial [Brassica napus]
PLFPNSRKPYHQRPSSDRRLIGAGGVDMHEALSCRFPSGDSSRSTGMDTGFFWMTVRPKEDGGGEGPLLEPRVWLDLIFPFLDIRLSPPYNGM